MKVIVKLLIPESDYRGSPQHYITCGNVAKHNPDNRDQLIEAIFVIFII